MFGWMRGVEGRGGGGGGLGVGGGGKIIGRKGSGSLRGLGVRKLSAGVVYPASTGRGLPELAKNLIVGNQ